MATQSISTPKLKVAVVFLGNTGAGKSTLLSQIGGSFPSGVRFMQGYTKDIVEHQVILNGKPAILMDTPGLYEVDDEATQANAKKLTEALKRGYDYKLFFVILAGNRGLTTEDVALMSIVDECIRQANGAKIDFQVIVNQINDDAIYNMYYEHVAKDNFRGLFASLKIKGHSFNISVNGVILILFDKSSVENKELKEIIAEQVEAQVPVKIKLLKDIVANNNDLSEIGKIATTIAGIMAAAALFAIQFYF
ncbi:hypothetical protein B0O80DRAFT_422801 [Mortierella sp. GBAus27b]|nr:hypothetical protein BGX31_009744 [Mortierella sp. GBA43]KAI8360158.1 hypothetical protein B0O80DRAFT_422801 [Mortierella sp. GBAus27b]